MFLASTAYAAGVSFYDDDGDGGGKPSYENQKPDGWKGSDGGSFSPFYDNGGPQQGNSGDGDKGDNGNPSYGNQSWNNSQGNGGHNQSYPWSSGNGGSWNDNGNQGKNGNYPPPEYCLSGSEGGNGWEGGKNDGQGDGHDYHNYYASICDKDKGKPPKCDPGSGDPDPAPLPGTLPMFGVGLALLIGLGLFKKPHAGGWPT